MKQRWIQSAEWEDDCETVGKLNASVFSSDSKTEGIDSLNLLNLEEHLSAFCEQRAVHNEEIYAAEMRPLRSSKQQNRMRVSSNEPEPEHNLPLCQDRAKEVSVLQPSSEFAR